MTTARPMRRGPGRPPKNTGENGRRITVSLSAEQCAMIESAARKDGLDLSAYLRMAALRMAGDSRGVEP
jgi:uncharacterized protein (DUF1778 family)